jgi:hypothetical protein
MINVPPPQGVSLAATAVPRFDCTIGFFGKAMSVLTRTRGFDRMIGFFVGADTP